MIFRVNARVVNRGEVKEVFFIAETDHQTMADLFDDFARQGMLHITRYDTRGPNEAELRKVGSRRIRFVVDQYEAIIAKDGFTLISEPLEDVIGQDGQALFLIDDGDAPLDAVAQQ